MHNPDKWVILKLTSNKDVYKILAGWQGGYIDPDTWRISSGLERIEDKDDHYLMHNYSGSVYKCYKVAEGLTKLTNDKLKQIQEAAAEAGISISLCSVEQFNEKE